MKFENFQKAEKLKKKIDALQDELDEVNKAIDGQMSPCDSVFQLSRFGTASIRFEHLNWSGMLQNAKHSLQYQIEKLKIEFEKLE